MRIHVPSYMPPRSCGLGFLAEAPGGDEVALELQKRREGKHGYPLVGKSGWRHEKILKLIGIDRWQCWHGNVFGFQLPSLGGKNNQLKPLLVPLSKFRELRDEAARTGTAYASARFAPRIERITAMPLMSNGWLPPEEWGELDRLYAEITQAVEDGLRMLVLYGGTALWAMTGQSAVKKMQGHIFETEWPGLRAICVNHPAYTFHRQTALQGIVLGVQKAWEEVQGGIKPYDEPDIYVPETVGELERLLSEMPRVVAVDIETPYVRYRKDPDATATEPPTINDRSRSVNKEGELFTVNSIQITGEKTIFVPFMYEFDGQGLWWRTEDEHLAAYLAVRTFLEDPGHELIFQRGTYDVQLLYELIDIRCRGRYHDTILRASAVNPEEEKSLTALAARELHMRPWKKSGSGFEKDEL